ncbi:glycoside hydrolase family 15 protein [Curtobacterium ammoniigenes]|uniref:glycoside hydrolase family 15 protein n=1 Tax=Curtobacterium ammoniigenes TaxID=395387 RepID=UPI000835CA0B|nr:glycoside hydrolase family 15 protein [Curtobacterium ammoniigenes]
MPQGIQDYALIGDCHTAALVGSRGSIDWLCLPRFDDGSVFGALLADEEAGRWLVRPTQHDATHRRHYIRDTMVLVTIWETDTGAVEVTDFMPLGDHRADLVRRVHGLRGSVEMRQDLRLRFEYGTQVPWVRQVGTADAPALLATAGPNSVVIRGPELHPHWNTHENTFTVAAGKTVDLTMTWFPSHRDVPDAVEIGPSLEHTKSWWREWVGGRNFGNRYHEEVKRSLLLLRALTHEETGGIVAAATTSLPEEFGGVRNWDYRYVWLRDASLTLTALMAHGYGEEARRWRHWLLRAIAGDPSETQIMYGIAGERYLPEREIESLPGYRGAAPVRVGNEAYLQYQGDVFGEVLSALHDARELGVSETKDSWALQRALLGHLEETWQRPDNGIWEIRGPQRRFTQSRAMIWAAFDRGVRAVEEHGFDGPVERWRTLRDRLHDEIHERGFDTDRGSFVQYYGSDQVDASLLVLAQIGFIAPDDPRMLGTVAAIEEDLLDDSTSLVLRYRSESGVDGLPGGENPFLACAFWLVEQYAMSGRIDDAERHMDQLLGYCNDVGMLSEEIQASTGRHAGNTPQAFSHLALVNAADAINVARSGSSQPRSRTRVKERGKH